MIRATTGGVLKSYRSNLMNSFISMNKNRDTVLSQRNFNSFAEDPAAAAKAFRLRKSRMTVDSQHSICQDVMKKYDTAYSCLQSVDEVLDTQGAIDGSFMQTLHGMTLKWLNDPTGDAREQLTKALDQASEQLVQTMNQKYGDNFIFAGADGHNVPFEVRQVQDDEGATVNRLYYRGVPVDAAVPDVKTDANDALVELGGDRYVLNSATLVEVPAGFSTDRTRMADDADGVTYYVKTGAQAETPLNGEEANYIEVVGIISGNPTYFKKSDLMVKEDYDNSIKKADGTPEEITVDGKTYYVVDDDKATIKKDDYDKQKLETDKLKYLAEEKYFVDIGLGFQENDKGNLIESSGFNASLTGLSFLGYGLDEDGDPKNIYSLVQRLTEISDSVPEGGSWDGVWPEFNRLVGKLETASSKFKTEFTNLAASTTKLENQEELLSDNFYNLQEQYSDLEDVDMVDSITSFIWAEYCYNAALKVGNSILAESLMDYLS